MASAGRHVFVPAVWPLEVTNALAVALRRKRITQPEIRRFIELLGALEIQQDFLPVAASVNNVLPLSHKYGLSAYDASYLEVAIRRGASLATLDASLERAGRKAEVDVFASTAAKPRRQ